MFRECPLGMILTPRITSEFWRAGAATARVDVEGFDSGGRLGGGASDPSRIWHFGL